MLVFNIKVMVASFFFLKRAGELCIIVLKKEMGKNPYNTHHTSSILGAVVRHVKLLSW
jgi:hypothetical protein